MKTSRVRWFWFLVATFVVANVWRYVALTVDRGSMAWYSAEAVRVGMWVVVGVAGIRYLVKLEERLAALQAKVDAHAGKLARIEGLASTERKGLRDGFVEDVLDDISRLDDGVTLIDE